MDKQGIINLRLPTVIADGYPPMLMWAIVVELIGTRRIDLGMKLVFWLWRR